MRDAVKRVLVAIAALQGLFFLSIPLWPYLLIAAMLVFLADVALRRIDFDLVLGRQKPPMKMVMAKR